MSPASAPERVTAFPRGPGRVEPPSGRFSRVFHATEEENRRAILRTIPPASARTLLDVGCHTGEFTARIASRTGAQHLHAVELIDAHAAAARERGIDAVVADVETGLPYADCRFDFVHTNQLIEHVRNTDLFVSEIRRVLKPGGLACISTNNLSSWHNIASLMLGYQPFPMHVSDRLIIGNPLNPEHGAPHVDAGRVHVRLFTGRALSELCAHHALACVRMRTSGYYPLPPRILGRLAARLDPRHGAFLIGLFRRAD